MKRSYLLFIMLALAVPLTLSSCAKDDAVEGQKNIVELAQGNSDLSSLVAGVKRAVCTHECSIYYLFKRKWFRQS